LSRHTGDGMMQTRGARQVDGRRQGHRLGGTIDRFEATGPVERRGRFFRSERQNGWFMTPRATKLVGGTSREIGASGECQNQNGSSRNGHCRTEDGAFFTKDEEKSSAWMAVHRGTTFRCDEDERRGADPRPASTGVHQSSERHLGPEGTSHSGSRQRVRLGSMRKLVRSAVTAGSGARPMYVAVIPRLLRTSRSSNSDLELAPPCHGGPHNLR